MVYTSISTSTYLDEFQMELVAIIKVCNSAFKYGYAIFLSAINYFFSF
jgi:hypothetical protein